MAGLNPNSDSPEDADDDARRAILLCDGRGCFTVDYSVSETFAGSSAMKHAPPHDQPDQPVKPREFLNRLGTPTGLMRANCCPHCGGDLEVIWRDG